MLNKKEPLIAWASPRKVKKKNPDIPGGNCNMVPCTVDPYVSYHSSCGPCNIIMDWEWQRRTQKVWHKITVTTAQQIPPTLVKFLQNFLAVPNILPKSAIIWRWSWWVTVRPNGPQNLQLTEGYLPTFAHFELGKENVNVLKSMICGKERFETCDKMNVLTLYCIKWKILLSWVVEVSVCKVSCVQEFLTL